MNDIALTLDVDWSPDFVIDAVAGILIESQVCATWFIKHNSPAIERLRDNSKLFELGIHPNFLPGSTHGSTPTEVLRHCMDLVPEATTMRTHGLIQSGQLLETALNETPIRVDVSLFLPQMPHIRPIQYERPAGMLIRVPSFWEDRYEMEVSQPSWRLCDELVVPGLKIFSFHPIHVYLNSSLPSYDSVKRLGRLPELSANDVAPYIQPSYGPQTLFREIIELLGLSENSRRICDIVHLTLQPVYARIVRPHAAVRPVRYIGARTVTTAARRLRGTVNYPRGDPRP